MNWPNIVQFTPLPHKKSRICTNYISGPWRSGGSNSSICSILATPLYQSSLRIFAFYTFSHRNFAESISHFIRWPISHFRIFALRILFIPVEKRLGSKHSRCTMLCKRPTSREQTGKVGWWFSTTRNQLISPKDNNNCLHQNITNFNVMMINNNHRYTSINTASETQERGKAISTMKLPYVTVRGLPENRKSPQITTDIKQTVNRRHSASYKFIYLHLVT